MSTKRLAPEEIISKLREAGAHLAEGDTIREMSGKLGVTDHAYYRGRADHGGMRANQAKRLNELERAFARPNLRTVPRGRPSKWVTLYACVALRNRGDERFAVTPPKE